ASLVDDRDLLRLASRLRPDVDARQTLAHVIWSVITEPGDGTGGLLRARRGTAAGLEILLSDPAFGLDDPELAEGRRRWLPRADRNLVRSALLAAIGAEIHPILPIDRSWPAAFGDLGQHTPVMLWAR